MLAIAGSLARKQPVPGDGRDVPDRHAAVRRPARRRGPDRRRPHLLPASLGRSAPVLEHLSAADAAATSRPSRLVRSARSCRRAALRQRPQARSAPHGAQPGDVRRRGRQRARDDPAHHGPRSASPSENVFAGLDRCVALVHRALRELRRGGRRGTRQGAGRRRCARRAPRRSRIGCAPDGVARGGRRARSSTLGDEVVVSAGRGHPGRRRGDRGHRERRRVGDHRRVRAGDPRVRRRPLGGHRRHPRPVRPDRRADHRQPGRDASSTG